MFFHHWFSFISNIKSYEQFILNSSDGIKGRAVIHNTMNIFTYYYIHKCVYLYVYMYMEPTLCVSYVVNKYNIEMKTTQHCIQNTLMCSRSFIKKKKKKMLEIFSDENSTNNIYGLIFYKLGEYLQLRILWSGCGSYE